MRQPGCARHGVPRQVERPGQRNPLQSCYRRTKAGARWRLPAAGLPRSAYSAGSTPGRESPAEQTEISRNRIGLRARRHALPRITLTPERAPEQSFRKALSSLFFGSDCFRLSRSLRREDLQHLHPGRNREQVLGLGERAPWQSRRSDGPFVPSSSLNVSKMPNFDRPSLTAYQVDGAGLTALPAVEPTSENASTSFSFPGFACKQRQISPICPRSPPVPPP